METGLEELWKNLSLTKEKQHDVVIKQNWVEETAHARRNCLNGKLAINRNINLEAMKTMLQKVWKISSGLVIKEVGDIIFVFHLKMEQRRT